MSSRSRMMGATKYININLNTGGGNKKQGITYLLKRILRFEPFVS